MPQIYITQGRVSRSNDNKIACVEVIWHCRLNKLTLSTTDALSNKLCFDLFHQLFCSLLDGFIFYKQWILHSLQRFDLVETLPCCSISLLVHRCLLFDSENFNMKHFVFIVYGFLFTESYRQHRVQDLRVFQNPV